MPIDSYTQTAYGTLYTKAGRSGVAVELSYESYDPYAVTLVLRQYGVEMVEWQVSRESIDEALQFGRSGYADVIINDHGRDTAFTITAPEGMAYFHILTESLRRFGRGCALVIPSGHEGEHVDWNRELSRLLGS